MYKQMSKVMFGSKDEGLAALVRPGDAFALWDARSPKTGSCVRSFVQQGAAAKIFRQRGGAVVRLLHHNKEFDPECRDSRECVRQRGHRPGKAVHCSSVPDPLESLSIVGGGEYFDKLPRRDRRYIDLPGHSGSMGWSQLSLRAASSRETNMVAPATKELIWTGAKSASEEYMEAGAGDGDAVLEEANDGPGGPMSLCEWEAPEAL